MGVKQDKSSFLICPKLSKGSTQKKQIHCGLWIDKMQGFLHLTHN